MHLNLQIRKNLNVAGMALPEMMVSLAVGALVLMVMALIFMSSARGFASMGNYITMDASSRNALDHMTRDIRQVGALVEFTPTHLKFSALGSPSTYLTYDWDSTSGQLTSLNTGDAAPTVLLTQCDQLAFSLCDFAFSGTTNLTSAKGIVVSWKCSRTVLGNKTTTENMQQGIIVMRNKR
jgi:hypothetical protein